ncbi:MAG TPA: hypothetical protein VGG56_13490 [Terracidiphilus sp.]
MKSRFVLVCVAMGMLAMVGLPQSSWASETATNTTPNMDPVVGIWRCEMDGLPAVTLTVTDEGGSLTGAILFYLHRREAGQPVTATPGVPEPLFNPRFDGKTLTFQVSHRRAHPPASLQDAPVTFELKLDGPDKAEFANDTEKDPNAPRFVLVKSAY